MRNITGHGRIIAKAVKGCIGIYPLGKSTKASSKKISSMEKESLPDGTTPTKACLIEARRKEKARRSMTGPNSKDKSASGDMSIQGNSRRINLKEMASLDRGSPNMLMLANFLKEHLFVCLYLQSLSQRVSAVREHEF